MKRLEDTGTRVPNFFSRALRAVTTNASSLLTWTKMCLSAGFVIIMVATLGVLLGALVRILNYKNGTKLQTGQIFHALLNSLWTKSLEKAKQNLNSRKNS